MKDVLRSADEIPVTLVTALAYGTLAVMTKPFGPPDEFAEHLHRLGHLTPNLVLTGEAWRLLAHAFLHVGPVHLLLNLASLAAFGPALERSLGSVRFLGLYLVGALGGGLLVCCSYDPRQPVVGGSGALFGLMGAAMAMNMRSGRHVLAFLDFEGPRRLVVSILVNLLFGVVYPMVSNTAHVGGLVAGFLVTFLWLRPGEPSAVQTRWRLASLALAAGAACGTFAPVARSDWLQRELLATPDPVRRADLLRAATRAAGLQPVAAPDRHR